MSLNFALGYLPDTALETLSDPGSGSLSFDEASSMDAAGPSATASGEDCLVVDPTMRLLDSPHFALDAGATVVALAGISDNYVLEVLGEQTRLRVFSEGELVEDDGDPIAAETILDDFDDPEDAHIALFCEVAGIEQEDLFKLRWYPLAG